MGAYLVAGVNKIEVEVSSNMSNVKYGKHDGNTYSFGVIGEVTLTPYTYAKVESEAKVAAEAAKAAETARKAAEDAKKVAEDAQEQRRMLKRKQKRPRKGQRMPRQRRRMPKQLQRQPGMNPVSTVKRLN